LFPFPAYTLGVFDNIRENAKSRFAPGKGAVRRVRTSPLDARGDRRATARGKWKRWTRSATSPRAARGESTCSQSTLANRREPRPYGCSARVPGPGVDEHDGTSSYSKRIPYSSRSRTIRGWRDSTGEWGPDTAGLGEITAPDRTPHDPGKREKVRHAGGPRWPGAAKSTARSHPLLARRAQRAGDHHPTERGVPRSRNRGAFPHSPPI